MSKEDIIDIFAGIIAFLGVGIVIITLIGFLYAIMGIVIAYIWNFVMPYIFGLPQITWVHGTALFILMSILFGGKNVKSSN